MKIETLSQKESKNIQLYQDQQLSLKEEQKRVKTESSEMNVPQ